MSNTTTYDCHPITQKYPDFTSSRFEELCQAIQDHGQRVPIVLWHGKIVDGRHRQAACIKLGIEPRCENLDCEEDELPGIVRCLNLHRRHLTVEEQHEHRQTRIERVAAAREAGQSLRAISQSENISEPQVRRDIEVAQVRRTAHLKPENGQVTGRDGRTYPATPKRHEGSATRDAALERIQRQQANGHTNGKPGKPVFDDREVESQIGKLVRTFDARAEVYGKSGAYKDVEKQMGLLLASWQRWQIETTGGKKR